MAYALKSEIADGFTPQFQTADTFPAIVDLGVAALEAGHTLLDVSHGPDDYPCKAADIHLTRANRAYWIKTYAAAGIALCYPR
jgi:hypothetical protein